VPHISYVDPDPVTDPDLARYLGDARAHGWPRLESQAIGAHVPAGQVSVGARVVT
jgi:hypothetical protein